MEQHQLLGRLSGLVDHLREGEEDNLSLADVASVTEVLIATMESYFRSVDTAIYRECRSLSDYITNARLEIAALSPGDLENARIPRAGLELDAIVQQTEEATNIIMTAAEEILGALDGDGKENAAKIETAVMQIFEACSFQDITGQRISKVVSTLSHIEQRVKDLHDLMGVTEEHKEAAHVDVIDPAAHSSDELARGPSLEGEGIDQGEVDSLLGGEEESSQGDIDALMADDGGKEESSQGDIDALMADNPAPGSEQAADSGSGGEDAGESATRAQEPPQTPEPEDRPEAPEAVAPETSAPEVVANDVAAEPDATAEPEPEPGAGAEDEKPEGDEENDALQVKGRTTSQEEIDSLFS